MKGGWGRRGATLVVLGTVTVAALRNAIAMAFCNKAPKKLVAQLAGGKTLKDLAVDRSAFDRIVESGGYITAPTGAARDANEILVPKEASDAAMDAAACIGCGACVAACPNSAAQLFTAAKYSHLSLLPQGQPERYTRVVAMVEEMEKFFGSCTNHGECEQACPKEISIDFIALLNRDFVKAQFKNPRLSGQRA